MRPLLRAPFGSCVSGVGADTGASASKVFAGTQCFLTHLSDFFCASLIRFRSALRHCAATTVYASPVLTLLWWQDRRRTPLLVLVLECRFRVFVYVMCLDSWLSLFPVPLTRMTIAGHAGVSALCLCSIVTFILPPQACWGFSVSFPVLASMVTPCPLRPLWSLLLQDTALAVRLVHPCGQC